MCKMAFSNLIFQLLGLMLCTTFVCAAGDQECSINTHGRMTMFSGEKQRMKLPCKYRATTMHCQGYDINVSPGQAFDGTSQYYVDTAWIAIKKKGTDLYWKGRTSTRLAFKYFETLSDPFDTKQENMTGADFTIVQTGDSKDRTVTLGVSDADFEITFRPYDYDGRRRAEKKAGISVSCPEATRLERYPDAFCGSHEDSDAIRSRKKKLGLDSMTQTLLHDLLTSNTQQTNPQCEIASTLLRKKCKRGNRAEAIKTCSPLINYAKHTRCLSKYHYDPMDVFVYCLRFVCMEDAFSCELMKDAIDGCNNVHGLSKVKCPVQ